MATIPLHQSGKKNETGIKSVHDKYDPGQKTAQPVTFALRCQHIHGSHEIKGVSVSGNRSPGIHQPMPVVFVCDANEAA
jgi:hypothetical protein